MRFFFVLSVLFLMLLLPLSSASASTTQTLSGTVTSVGAGSFIYQTGFPHGHVGVFYSASEVVPSGTLIKVGQVVSVTGSFNAIGQIVATQVTVGSVSQGGPYHIATYAYDSYWAQGYGISAASVNLLLSYAQGNDKAVVDCHSGSHSCKAVFYMNPNHEFDYSPAACVNHPDADVLAAASESWFVHNPGYTDSAHRIYGKSQSGCFIWEMNPASTGVQAWWRTHLRAVADTYDLYLLDNDPMDVPDASYFPFSGGGCNPWPSVCKATQEFSTNAALVAARASFVRAMSHRNGSPMNFVYQQASTIPLDLSALAASNRLVGFTCEGCVSTYAAPVRPNLYAKVLAQMAAANASTGMYLLLSHGNAPAGSAVQVLQRLATTGIVWLGYKEGHTTVQPDLESNTNNLAVWPEDLIYPAAPLQSMASGPVDLQVAPGIYRREFGTCYQAGALFGRCAVIVNGTASTVTTSASWLTHSYGHVVMLSGGDVLSAGIASVHGTLFAPNATAIVSGGAILLAQ